ncbi:MAG: hypothetical protein LQ340_004891 [Diploschistes diacapsis]|nr:MAG: hypothetical protein LQ340_004891 [Diploschistes diacapsis]
MPFFDILVIACRIAQFVLSVIVLGCTGYLVSIYRADIYNLSEDFIYYGVPSSLSFLLFVAVWSIIIVAWQILTPRFAERLAHRFVILGLDALTMLFWFAGFIALAVITPPAYGTVHGPYATQQAAVAFGAFAWLAFLVTTILSAIDIFRGHGGKHNPELQNAA